jgi:hypothetical protein
MLVGWGGGRIRTRDCCVTAGCATIALVLKAWMYLCKYPFWPLTRFSDMKWFFWQHSTKTTFCLSFYWGLPEARIQSRLSRGSSWKPHMTEPVSASQFSKLMSRGQGRSSDESGQSGSKSQTFSCRHYSSTLDITIFIFLATSWYCTFQRSQSDIPPSLLESTSFSSIVAFSHHFPFSWIPPPPRYSTWFPGGLAHFQRGMSKFM